MRESSFKQIKLSQSLENTENCHKGICFARLRQIQLQQLFTGRVNCFEGDSPQFFFFWGGGYHPTLKLSGIPTFTFILSLTHRMDNI